MYHQTTRRYWSIFVWIISFEYVRDNTDCSAYLEEFVVICTLLSDLGRANLCCKISLDWAAMSGERERAFAAPSLSASHFLLSRDKIFQVCPSRLSCRAGRVKNRGIFPDCLQFAFHPSSVPDFQCIQLREELWGPRRSGVVHQGDAKMGLMRGMQHVGAMLCPFG